ncbi:MAG: peptidyl-prolyl cis-trans isomerase [Cyclobacteriaceae bacterium]|nr:peptidyl-prolyl cis-trans isomerase [Cyclobacteriaceae bacterium]
MRLIIYSLILVVFCSCDAFETKQDADSEKQRPIARVKDNYLYAESLAGLVEEGYSYEDSVVLVDRYIDSWVKKQLMIAEASNNLKIDEAELERRILDYRFALISYEFERQEVDANINFDISEEEILEYYNSRLDDFELKQNIVKGTFIKVPKEAPELNNLRRIMRRYSDQDKEELKSYAYRFASSYILEDSVWYKFDEVIKNTPFMSIPNKVQFLKNNRFAESEDENEYYFIRIQGYKISEEVSPVEFVSDDIRNILINKRKAEIVRNLRDEIYEKAKNNNDFEIFN